MKNKDLAFLITLCSQISGVGRRELMLVNCCALSCRPASRRASGVWSCWFLSAASQLACLILQHVVATAGVAYLGKLTRGVDL